MAANGIDEDTLASMWPRSEDRGNRYSGGYTYLGAWTLQCGLGPKTEEIYYIKKGLIAGELSFNVASVRRPRKYRGP